MSPRLRVLLFVAGIAIGIVLVLLGFSAMPLCIAALAPWLLVLAGRLGASLGITLTLFAGLLLLMTTQFVTTPLGLPLLATSVVVFSALGVGGIVMQARVPRGVRVRRTSAIWAWVAGLPGAIAWGVALVLSAVIPSAAQYAWVLMGDTANNTLIARDVIMRDGLAAGANANPVPLTSALLAFEMAPGRVSAADSLLARNDILAIASLWAVAIAVLCVVAGAVVALMVRAVGAPLPVTLAAGGAASLLPLSWFFSGYPMEYGFLNAQPAMVVVLGAVAAHFAVRRSPAASFIVQCLAATLALAVWSPLVLVPLALAAITGVRYRARVWRVGGVVRVLLWVSIAQFVLFAFGLTLPAVINAPTSLVAPGGVFSFRHWLLPALAVVALAGSLLAFRRILHDVVIAVAATAVASGAGLAFLLFVARNLENPWSYYPLKFSWLMAAAVLVLLVGAAAAMCVRYLRRVWLLVVGLLLVAAVTVGFLEWAPHSGAPYISNSAIGHVLAGDLPGNGDDAADEIFDDARPDVGHILWQSGDPLEGTINFWVWQLWANSITGDFELRTAAYGLYDHDDIDDLCRIIGYMDATVVVETQDATLVDQLHDACPTLAPNVRVELR